MSGIHQLLAVFGVVFLISAAGVLKLGAPESRVHPPSAYRVVLTDGSVLHGELLGRASLTDPALTLRTSQGRRLTVTLRRVRSVLPCPAVQLSRLPRRVRSAAIEARARKLILGLSAPRGVVRHQAEKALLGLGEGARPILEKARLTPEPEVRLRVGRVLRTLDRRAGGSQMFLRRLR